MCMLTLVIENKHKIQILEAGHKCTADQNKIQTRLTGCFVCVLQWTENLFRVQWHSILTGKGMCDDACLKES